MRLRNFATILLIILTLILISSCDIKGDAIGSYNKIPVLVDSEQAGEAIPVLSKVLEREIRTPQKEKLFRLEIIDSSRIETITNARTSIIIGSIDSPGPTGNFIRSVLSSDAIKMIKSGEYWLIVREDLWADGQLVIFITGRTMDQMLAHLELNNDKLFDLVNSSTNQRICEWLYGAGVVEDEKIELEDSIALEYGFGIRVPRFFDWEKGTGDERFLWLRRLEPERWIFVWWTPLDSASDFSVSRWIDVRDSLCAVYYEGDSVSPHFIPETTVTYIGDRPAVQIRALWENPDTKLGGPIISYVFSDLDTRRLYIVDGAVFAPGVEKEPYLRHVEIICRSFRSNLPKFYDEREEREN